MPDIAGRWTCSNGHANFGGSSCPACGAQARLSDGGGVNPIILFSWMGLLFAAPVYPFAGGAAFLGALGMNRLGMLVDMPPLALFPVLAAATIGGFYAGYLVEKRVSNFRAYRILRDLIRFAVGALIIFNMGSGNTADAVPAAEIIGVIILFPIVLFMLRRLDVALSLAGPDADPDAWSFVPDWLYNLGEKLRLTQALAFGALGGVVAFALGGDAPVLTGLIVCVMITLIVIIAMGGFAIVSSIDEKIGGLIFKIFIGVPLGAVVAAFVMHTPDGRPLPEGLAIGAILGPLALILWGMISRRRNS